MTSIYTVFKVLCQKDAWALVKVDSDTVVAGTWPCNPLPGQRFRGIFTRTHRGGALNNISHVNADENAFRKLLHDRKVSRKEADALLKNGFKKLRTALKKNTVHAFKRWKGVGKATAAKALDTFQDFSHMYAFRERWFDTYPSLEEKYRPEFDDFMRGAPQAWKNPFKVLLKAPKFWGQSEDSDKHIQQFATIIADEVGISRDDMYRKRYERAASILQQTSESGSTWVRASTTTCPADEVDPYVVENTLCTLEKYNNAERTIARVIDTLLAREESLEPVPQCPQLDDTQIQAVHSAITKRVFILCGGAGVGKSRTLVQIVRQLGEHTLVCAPTGKAVVRLIQEGIEARTLHSAMYMQQHDHIRNLVLDEQSMQDIVILAALLEKLTNLERIVFVGDPFQLPSVGPGALLRDLLACERISRTRLTTVYRQEGGLIVENANRIRRGNTHIRVDESFQRCSFDASRVVERFLRTPNATIVAATNKTVATLNKMIHARIPHRGPCLVVKFYGYGSPWKMYVGDPMMNVKNVRDGDMYIANGDVGTITSISEKSVTVDFGHTSYSWTGERAIQEHLRPTYAITIHKAQGSEYPHVICVVEYSRGMHRQTLYTAVTRAKKTCTVFETPGALDKAIRTRPPLRKTMLLERLNTCSSPITTPSPPSSLRRDAFPTTPAAPVKESLPTRKRLLERPGASTAKRRLIFESPIKN